MKLLASAWASIFCNHAIVTIDSSIILILSFTGPRHDLQSGCFVTNAWYQQSCFVISYVREIKSMQVCTVFSAVKLSVICHYRWKVVSFARTDEKESRYRHPLTGKTYLRKLVYKPIDSVVQKDQLSFPCWASLAKFEFPFSPFSGSVQFFCCLFCFPLLVCTVVSLFLIFNKILTVGASLLYLQ